MVKDVAYLETPFFMMDLSTIKRIEKHKMAWKKMISRKCKFETVMLFSLI
jgi:hypothetical protein